MALKNFLAYKRSQHEVFCHTDWVKKLRNEDNQPVKSKYRLPHALLVFPASGGVALLRRLTLLLFSCFAPVQTLFPSNKQGNKMVVRDLFLRFMGGIVLWVTVTARQCERA